MTTRCRFSCFTLLQLTLALAGCKPTERDCCRVEGNAHFDNQPLAGYLIVFTNPEIGGGGGVVDSSGHFKFGGPMAEGDYVVSFDIPPKMPGEVRPEIVVKNLPEKYKNPSTSDYHIQLVPGMNSLTVDVKSP